MTQWVGRLRDFPYFWWDRTVASDAGLIRLQSAVRVTAAVVLTFGVIDALSHATALPMAMIVMGIIESLFGSVAVNDASPAKQRVTLALMPLPTAAALTIGTLLAPSRAIGDTVFILVIFAATYARRFGPRATAFGMLAYISFFLGLFLHLNVAALPDQFLAMAIGTGAAYIVRFVLIPDRPERTLRRVLAAFYGRIERIMEEVEAVMRAGVWDRRSGHRMRLQMIRLNETALAAESQIEAIQPGHLAPASLRSTLGLRLFDLEVAAGRLVDAAGPALPPVAERPALNRALRSVRETLRAGPGAERPADAQFAGARGMAGPMARAIRNLDTALRAMPAASGKVTEAGPPEPAASDAPESDAMKDKLLPATRAAIQVTLACAIAIVPGELLSPSRWYWAVITVFVMFSGTQSRGDVLTKGLQRAIGTLVGVGAGIVVATAVSGAYALSIGLIVLCVFLAFYFVKASYGLMVFWISILIALLYGLLGEFTPALLLLRIEETAIGAVVGVVVGGFVLPTRSRRSFIAASRSFLQAVADLVRRAVAPDPGNLSGLAREADRRFQVLRVSGAPLLHGFAGAFASTQARRWGRAFLACDSYARGLGVNRLQSGQAEERGREAVAEQCRRIAARIDTRIDRVLEAMDRTPARLGTPAREPAPAEGSPSEDRGEPDPTLRALAGIDIAIRLLARDLGVADPD